MHCTLRYMCIFVPSSTKRHMLWHGHLTMLREFALATIEELDEQITNGIFEQWQLHPGASFYI